MRYKSLLYSSSKQVSFYFIGFFILLLLSASVNHIIHKKRLFRVYDSEHEDASIQTFPDGIPLDKDDEEVHAVGELEEETAKPTEWVVSSGETLESILQDIGIDQLQLDGILKCTTGLLAKNPLKPGNLIELSYNTKDSNKINRIKIRVATQKFLEINATTNDFAAKEVLVPLKRKLVKLSATVSGSFTTTLSKMQIPNNIAMSLVKAYSYDIDFERDIKAGNTIELLVGKYYTEDGTFSHNGDVLFSALDLGGRVVKIYNFTDKNGNQNFFNENALSVQKSLLRTPVNATRISSGFGMRKHPIFGYSRMHKGIDFAARAGTPVASAGKGDVEIVGIKAGYGKYIRIKHNNVYSSAYAHLHRFAKGIMRGSKVKQGQIIGYVGSSGSSTGPHLHFEVLKHGVQINPKQVKQTSDSKLQGKDLAKFIANKKEVDELMTSMLENTEIDR